MSEHIDSPVFTTLKEFKIKTFTKIQNNYYIIEYRDIVLFRSTCNIILNFTINLIINKVY